MSMFRVFSCVVGRGCLLWPVHCLGKICPASFRIPRLNLPVTPGVSWLPTFAFQSPIMKRTSFLCVLVLKVLVGLHRIIQLKFLYCYWWGIGLDYCNIEWFSLEINGDYSVIFEIASKYWILDSFIAYDGYSISSKGFLPTVVDIMVIWVQFSPVQFSHSAVSNYLWTHELQHACPSSTHRVHTNSCPSSQWCHPAISFSVVPLSSCHQSLPASESFPVSQLFTWGGQSIGVSALASVLPKNTQDWSPL